MKNESLLEYLRKRPGMFFGGPEEEYMNRLDAFLNGFQLGKSGKHLEVGEVDVGPEFSEWLVKVKQMEGGSNVVWPRLLEMNYDNPKEAYDAFFDLYDEFSKMKNLG